MKGKFEELINSEVPVIIDWYADWCGPCKTLSPILEEVKKAMGDKVKIYKLDTEKNRELQQKYNVRSIPTIMLFKGGEMLFNEAGLQNKQFLIDLILDTYSKK